MNGRDQSSRFSRGLAGDAFIAIWHDLAPEGVTTFYEWHNREHMPERLAIPGFRRGRRYRRVADGGAEYFNLYEVDQFATLVGPEYLARLNAPTPWTREAVAHFRNVTRGLCHVAGSTGIGSGGFIATQQIATAPDREDCLRRHLVGTVIPALVEHAGILGAHLGVTDAAGSGIPTAEKRARSSATAIPPWVLLVEGISAQHLRDALNVALSSEALVKPGVAMEPLTGIYHLEAMRLPDAS